MGLFERIFRKKQRPTTTEKERRRSTTELKCLVAGCPFTCRNPATLKRHTDWKHPELAKKDDK